MSLVLEVLLKLVLLSRLCFCSIADFQSQSFFQTNKVLSLALDSTNEFSSDIFPALGLDEGRVPASPVRFDPPYLDFKEHPVGQPHLEQVTLINGQEKKSLQLLSISATTPHFHCSFFQRKVVPAGENTTFDVVFLAREVGSAENTLFIRTSAGTYRYQVFGVGVTSPYRVQPWLGARIPVNGSFSPYLHLHNPHERPLQITEMFTSGPDLHLELPPRAATGRHLWEIPPYETRTVMRLRLVGRAAANHTAFVQVKLTNHSGGRFGLVLPVEVEVSGQSGLYTAVDRLDFGLLRTLDSERTLTLQITSLDPQPVLVTNVSLDSPNDAVRIDFHQTRVLPGAWRQTPLADVTFTAHRAQASRQWSGNVIVTGAGQRELLRVPYRASVLQGALVYDANSTRFLLAPSPSSPISRPISISNTFAQPVVIFNASLPADQSDVSLEDFRPPVVIPAGATRAPFSLRVRAGAVARVLQLAIYSNASHFLIPVFLYTGGLRLVPRWPEPRPDGVDFGSLGPGERRRVEVALRNENPVDVSLLGVESDQPGLVRPQLLRVRRLDGSPVSAAAGAGAAEAAAEPEPELPLKLRPFHQVDVALNVIGPSRPGPQPGELLVRASPADLRLRWQMRGADGSLSAAPDPFLLTDCFPGRQACRLLSVRSSFHELVSLRGLTFLPRDDRFRFTPVGLPQLLKPFETTTVGRICFDHQLFCGDDCYAGFSLYTATGQEWLLGLNLDSRVAEVDQLHLDRLAQRWDALARSDRLVANATVAMETAHAGGFLMRAQAHLTRPGLLPAGWRLEMPLTHAGNASEMELLVNNPSDSPVLAQLLPMSLYLAPSSAAPAIAQQHPANQHHQQLRGHQATKPPGTPDAEDAMSQASETSSSEERRSNSGSIGEKSPPPPPPPSSSSSSIQTPGSVAGRRRGSASNSVESAPVTPLAVAPRVDEDDTVRSRGRRRGGGRVKSRSTATNTPNSIVRPSDLQPLLPAIPAAKAAPLQPTQVLKQLKTSIVKPMTHQKPKRGFEDAYDEMEKQAIQWDVPASQIYQEDMEDIARRSQQLLMLPPQKVAADSPGFSGLTSASVGSVSVAAVAPTQSLPPPPPPPPPPPLLEPAWQHLNPWLPTPAPQRPLPPTVMSELSQVTLQKTQSLFSYEEQLRRLQQQQQQQQQQHQQQQMQLMQQQQVQQQSVWYSGGDSLGLSGIGGGLAGALDTSWTESTVSNRNLWGGFVDEATAACAAGSADDPVARMLLGEPLLWGGDPSYAPPQLPDRGAAAWGAFSYQPDATGDRK